MGFLGSVFNDGVALRHDGSHHNVHGGAHGHHIQVDVGALEPAVLRGGGDKATLHHYLGTQGGKALDVLVDGADAEVAAAGHGDFRLAETAKQRADEIIGGTDLPGQLIRGAGRADMGAVDLHRVAIDCTDVGPQLFQNLQTQRHIGDLGNIFNAADTVHHQRGGDDGDGGVFRTADGNLSGQSFSAPYN